MQGKDIPGPALAPSPRRPRHFIVALTAVIVIAALFLLGALISLTVVGMNISAASDPGLALGCADQMQQSCQQLQTYQAHLAVGIVGVFLCGAITVVCGITVTVVAVLSRAGMRSQPGSVKD